ncbi:hypothetical protein IF1G_07495 [Cordyceps javanica]|uniref:Uncharacterized protein n=1 Tax=Cordyceps javanica TaxID=43265 RepID=A0A545UWB9_9HYPO|nr:hypothetical protein IF1G_07495 [Cordyceps javanica]
MSQYIGCNCLVFLHSAQTYHDRDGCFTELSRTRTGMRNRINTEYYPTSSRQGRGAKIFKAHRHTQKKPRLDPLGCLGASSSMQGDKITNLELVVSRGHIGNYCHIRRNSTPYTT